MKRVAPEVKKLRHYTTIKCAEEIIRSQYLRLSPPTRWKDQNDIWTLDFFQKVKHRGKVTVHVLCMTGIKETFHHWEIFGKGEDGVCMIFDRKGLTKNCARAGIIFDEVCYPRLTVKKDWENISIDKLPWVKRSGYVDENEYRFVKKTSKVGGKNVKLPFARTTLNAIIINPFASPSQRKVIKERLHELFRNISGYDTSKIKESTLTNSPYWQKVVENKFKL